MTFLVSLSPKYSFIFQMNFCTVLCYTDATAVAIGYYSVHTHCPTDRIDHNNYYPSLRFSTEDSVTKKGGNLLLCIQ